MLKHENIVELYDYTENEQEIVLLMEYCNDANYFEEKLEEVSLSTIYTMTSNIDSYYPEANQNILNYVAKLLRHCNNLNKRSSFYILE